MGDSIRSKVFGGREEGVWGRGPFWRKVPSPKRPPLSLPRLSTLSNPCSDLSLWRRGERLSILMRYLFTIHRCNLPFREHKTPQLNCPTKKEPVNLTDQPALFLSYDRDFLRAASPLYKSLRWRAGFGEGRRNPFFRRVPPPQSLSIFPVTPYGSMKLKGPA